jgi:hypothetical protein
MIIEKLYTELHDNGIVDNKQTFAKRFLNCNQNTLYVLKKRKRDISTNNKLTCLNQLHKTKKTIDNKHKQAINKCIQLITENIASNYKLRLTPISQ